MRPNVVAYTLGTHLFFFRRSLQSYPFIITTTTNKAHPGAEPCKAAETFTTTTARHPESTYSATRLRMSCHNMTISRLQTEDCHSTHATNSMRKPVRTCSRRHYKAMTSKNMPILWLSA